MQETEPPLRDSETLPRSREIYKALVAYSRDAILGVNRKGTITFWNNGAERLFGYSAEEILGKPVTGLISQKLRQGRTSAFRSFLSGNCGETRTIVGEALRKDGSTFPVELSFSIEQQNGKSVALAVGRDISQHKQMQQALRESAERYCNLLSACLETVFSEERQDGAETAYQAVEKLSGRCLQELLDMTPRGVLSPERKRFLSGQAEKASNKDEPSSSTVHQVLTREGKEMLIERYLGSLNAEDKGPGFHGDATECVTADGRLKSSFVNLARIISHIIEFCDPYTANHQERVAELACLVARNMGLADDVVERLYFDGLLHDVGKISIPRSILTKPGELADEEWALIRAHTKQGYSILKDANLPWPTADAALQHHERLDGSGYPDGIAADDLGLEVNILAVCDVVEAMSSHRPYRPARTTEEVLKELAEGRGTRYDAGVVDVIMPKIATGEFKSIWSCADSKCAAK
jgi:PAS domain S-box-containing protein